jgi:nicotinamidase-related amidase
MGDALLPFPLTERSVHLCVDTQRIFSADGPWPAPRMERVLPIVAPLAGRHPELPSHPLHPARAPGSDAGHVAALLHALAGDDPRNPQRGLLELMPPLATLCPPATVIDKTRYSGLAEPKLLAHLREREADALIISGSESDRAERG